MRCIQWFIGLAVLFVLGNPLSAGILVGVTGDGANEPSSLFYLNQTDASASFIMTLGNGNDGEAIAFNPDDGLLYHASGIADPDPDHDAVWESIDLATQSIVTSGKFQSVVTGSENLAMVFNPATGRFLVSHRDNDFFFDTTFDGVGTDIGETDDDMKGLAFVGGTLYGAAVRSELLYMLDPTDGSTISTIDILLGGTEIQGTTGLAFDPDSGELWGIFKQNGERLLGTLDPTTGVATSVGILPDNFAGLAFVRSAAVVPEPGTFAMFGLGTLFMGIGATRRRRSKASVARVS